MAKLCPHCKVSTSFKATIKKKGVVSLNNDQPFVEHEDNDDFTIIIESCALCGKPVKILELITAKNCDLCNELAPIDSMQVMEIEGEKKNVCPACHAKETRADLNQMSQQQLIMRLLELERQAKGE